MRVGCGMYGSHDVYYDVNSASPPLLLDFHRASTSENLVFLLQTTSNKLQNAFQGIDVSWIDSGMLVVMSCFMNQRVTRF